MISKDVLKRLLRRTVMEAPLHWSAADLADAIDKEIDAYFEASESWVAVYDRDATHTRRRWIVKNVLTKEFHTSARDKKIIRYEFEASARAVANRLNAEGV